MKWFSTGEVELYSLHDLRAVADIRKSNFILHLKPPQSRCPLLHHPWCWWLLHLPYLLHRWGGQQIHYLSHSYPPRRLPIWPEISGETVSCCDRSAWNMRRFGSELDIPFAKSDMHAHIITLAQPLPKRDWVTPLCSHRHRLRIWLPMFACKLGIDLYPMSSWLVSWILE